MGPLNAYSLYDLGRTYNVISEKLISYDARKSYSYIENVVCILKVLNLKFEYFKGTIKELRKNLRNTFFIEINMVTPRLCYIRNYLIHIRNTDKEIKLILALYSKSVSA